MPAVPAGRRLPPAVRRRLEVATATAWEALAETHVANALQFVELMAGRLPFEDAVRRYLHEMDVPPAMAAAVRNRVLVALEEREEQESPRPPLRLAEPHEPEKEADEKAGWRRFRPDVVVRGVRARHRRHEAIEQWVKLAIARAEENIINTHINNAITFAALLEDHYPLDRCVAEYLAALSVTGSRGQAVFQRTMARIADARLPIPNSPAGAPRSSARRGDA